MASSADRLFWNVAPGALGCPGEVEFRQRLAEKMGVDPFAAEGAPRFEVLIEHERGKFAAAFRKSTDSIVNRRFIGGDATNCSDLVDALVLAFSLLLHTDPDLTTSDQPKEAANDRFASLAPRLTDVDVVCPRPECPPPSQQPKRAAWLSMGPLLATGDLPKAAVGAMGSGGLELVKPWEFIAGAAYLAMERAERFDTTFAFSLTEGWLGLGVSIPVDDRLRWRLQFAPTLGVIHGFPESHLPFDPGDSSFMAVRLATQLGVEVAGPIGLVMGLSSELRLKRWEFRLRDDARVVWRQPYLGARAELLLSYGFE